ncbi:MAG TPA: sulfatase, partial [Oceanipulchritudo sp.]|nr:sulfatase [Oceanipulchritudo sp.]
QDMNRREFSRMAAIGSAIGMVPLKSEAKAQVKAGGTATGQRRPNLLFIFPDQFRLQALGIWSKEGYREAIGGVSDPVFTPCLDKLAKESVLFTQACSTFPLCSPYRGMLMSGMYPANNGVENNCRTDRKDSLRHDVDCLTDVLHSRGYETAYVGKTHWEQNENLFDEEGNYVGLQKAPGGHPMNDYDTYIPEGRGRHSVKYWFQCVKDVHKDPRVYSTDPARVEGKRDGEQHRPGVYSPRLESDVIVDYLKNTDNQRDAAQPFCLIWAPNPPHNPYGSEEDCDEIAYREHYKGKSPRELLNRPNLKAQPGNQGPESVAYYFANVTGIDKQVQRVLQALEEIGEADNTVVVFTSDHGEMMGSQGEMGKNFIYEESFLVPLMIRFPQQLNHRLEDLMLTPVDFMPTLLGLLGLGRAIPETVEGTNYAEALRTGDFGRSPKPETVPYIGPGKRGIRSNRYSLVVDEGGSTLLFDHKEDPYQLRNIPFSALPGRVRSELLASLGSWLKRMNDPWYHQKIHADLIDYPA